MRTLTAELIELFLVMLFTFLVVGLIYAVALMAAREVVQMHEKRHHIHQPTVDDIHALEH